MCFIYRHWSGFHWKRFHLPHQIRHCRQDPDRLDTESWYANVHICVHTYRSLILTPFFPHSLAHIDWKLVDMEVCGYVCGKSGAWTLFFDTMTQKSMLCLFPVFILVSTLLISLSPRSAKKTCIHAYIPTDSCCCTCPHLPHASPCHWIILLYLAENPVSQH